jgi:hypothetical protein
VSCIYQYCRTGLLPYDLRTGVLLGTTAATYTAGHKEMSDAQPVTGAVVYSLSTGIFLQYGCTIIVLQQHLYRVAVLAKSRTGVR